jgi:hypothetical protein
MPKGYTYRIIFSQPGYRKTVMADIKLDANYNHSEFIKLTPNVLGGTAMSRTSNLSASSNLTGWNMSKETEGEIIFETNNGASNLQFSGYTIDKYQYAYFTASNITDTVAHPTYEKDPTVGFNVISASGKFVAIGLREKGIRYRERTDVWAPIQVDGYGKDTVNHIDVSGKHKDTLEMIRLQNVLFVYINDKYMGSYTLDDEFKEEAVIGITGNYVGYSKIKFTDYAIVVGQEAVEIAKERVGFDMVLDDSIYGYNDDWETDYNMPLIEIGGMTEIEKEDGSIEKVAISGNTYTFTRTEHADPSDLYIISQTCCFS